ncbi:uncharacterized protein [Ptychodera flava]|uniref:uncharacterized protein n=1 Tax=Ptychodera flava TaxID=63121 RepID=UPI00396AA72C
MLIQPSTHQATDSVQQRQIFESPEQQQMPSQCSEQPVSHQQFQSSLEGETQKRKHQHSHDETNVSPDVYDSGQTSMRNVRHKSGRAPQFEHSSHHEGVASSSTGEQCTSDITDTLEHQRNRQRHYEFVKLLLRIAGDLGKEELESMKFLCRNSKSMEILKGEIEDIHHARDLFQKLLDRNLISADDSTLLFDLLQQISRVDLAQKISPIQPHNVTESIKWLQKYLQEIYKRHYKDFKPIPWKTAVSEVSQKSTQD